ncbi:hypothetical protein [Trinickia acidisoli]|uniref:hypothetical protein n=1 Tax=Trinickia acidisoli TaxID=2767482 RepID=UPI001A8ED4F7|nr:hypothetical protein [Trinickia acidisoli]
MSNQSRGNPPSEASSFDENNSFHLSEHGSVMEGLASRRLAYSSDSSRRLTSYEGSSVASDTMTITRSYRGSLTPSGQFALQVARIRGRLAAPSIRAESRASTPTDVSSLHLTDREDILNALDTGRLGRGSVYTESRASTPTDSSFHLSERHDLAGALASRRLAYSSDSSRRLTSYDGSSRFSGASIEVLAGAGASGRRSRLSNVATADGTSDVRPARAARISPDEFWGGVLDDSRYGAG